MAQTVYSELYNLAYSWICYMNNEAVIAYNEQNLAAYKAGLKDTPFEDIASGMVTEAVSGGKSSQRARNILGGFLGTGEAINNNMVKNVIIAVIEDYLDTGKKVIGEAVKTGDYLHCNDVPYQAGKTFVVTGTDAKGNFIVLDTDLLAQKGAENLDFTNFWRISPEYLEQHFSAAE